MITAGIALRALLIGSAFGSLVWAALPVARHARGLIQLEEPNLHVARASQHETVDVTAILEFAPFGRVITKTPAVPVRERVLPDLALRGVIVSTGTKSTALIDVDGTTNRYLKGDTVAPGWSVIDVASGSVKLSGGTGEVTLWLDEPSEDAPVAMAEGNLAERVKSGLVVPVRYAPPKPPETTAEYIDYWRKRIRKNPVAVLDDIGLTPTGEGYVIRQSHDVGVRLAGLKAGDLVRRVNGHQVGDPTRDRRLYDQIAASGHARLEVDRAGQPLTFSFPLR